MQPRDLFGASVRFIGLISGLYGVYDLFFVACSWSVWSCMMTFHRGW